MDKYGKKQVKGSGLDYFLEMQQKSYEASWQEDELTPLRVLGMANGRMPMGQLASKSRMESSLFSSAIRRMHQDLLIRVDGSTTDPENISVELTPNGWQLLRKLLVDQKTENDGN